MKNKGKAMAVWNWLKDKPSVGIIERDEKLNMVLIAKPMGVVGAIAPVTNPVMTPMHNAMIALKGRNAIIVCPHPSGKKTGVETVKTINEALAKIGAPENLVQVVAEPTLEISSLVMQMSDVCLATGGPGMVKAAYSSGKPALGVGAGNMQCLVDKDATPAEFVPKVMKGRTYDNGVLCTCEQNCIYPIEMEKELMAEFAKHDAYYIDDPQKVIDLRNTVFPEGQLNKQVVGLSAEKIAKLANIEVPEGTKVLIAKADGPGAADVFSKEKLFPVLTAFPYKEWDEAVDIAVKNLLLEGAGHSSVIHSNTKANIEKAAIALPVSRILVNGVGSSGVGGAPSNGFAPTATLGCGSWGGNSVSENVDYKHMINISRLGYTDDSKPGLDADKVWAD
jgi:succinate-semialdehyde dehydrogenase